MAPLLVKPVSHKDGYAGFDAVSGDDRALAEALTSKQFDYWQRLPQKFSHKEAAGLMSKSNFSRLSKTALSLGRLKKIPDGYAKL